MIVAKLSRAGVDDRSFSLDPGLHRLGSDFSCEIALIHAAVAPEHLTLKVEEDSVSILPKPGTSVTLFKHLTQQTITLPEEEWTPWHLGDRLIISDISIEIGGVKPEEPPRPRLGQRLFERSHRLLERPLSRALLAVIFLVTLTGVVNLLFPCKPDSPTAAHAKAQDPGARSGETVAKSAAGEPPAGLPADPTSVLREKLTALGVSWENLTGKGQEGRATLRVRDAALRAQVQSMLADLGLPYSPDIYVDEDIAEAAALTVTNLGAGSQVLDSKDGVVTLSAIGDPTLREKIVQTLKSDVPGLAGVRFKASTPVDLAALAKRVTAIWPGPYPYVVVDDGAIVRPGETLGQDARLVAVANRYLLVEVNGYQKKVVIE